MDNKQEQSRSGTETSRSKKLEAADLVYNCECGKSYLTFSALYLHAKLKHDIRLSNKRNETNHKLQVTNNKKILTYFLKQTVNNSENEYNNHQNIDNEVVVSQPFRAPKDNGEIIKQYLEFLQYQRDTLHPHITTFNIILKAFLQYLDEVEKLEPEDQEEEALADIPKYFNEFVTFYIPTIRKADSLFSFKTEVIVQVLYQFWKWLKTSGLTNIELICQECYITEAIK